MTCCFTITRLQYANMLLMDSFFYQFFHQSFSLKKKDTFNIRELSLKVHRVQPQPSPSPSFLSSVNYKPEMQNGAYMTEIKFFALRHSFWNIFFVTWIYRLYKLRLLYMIRKLFNFCERLGYKSFFSRYLQMRSFFC